mmetsp:Transcript_15800/g.44792  ORF Transcript_15800/g.44792 Transcript_15800/m.44792 type:complete len:269 (-) Transcript_15800:954-1760(-)
MSVLHGGDGEAVVVEKRDFVTIIRLNRVERKNAVDRPTAEALKRAFLAFERDPASRVAVLAGNGGTFCAGADLHAVAEGGDRMNRLDVDGDGPMGISRMVLSKPLLCAIDGYCVAGGLELALLADLRIASPRALFGVFCRRWGVPLIDGGTIRLPRVVGLGRALDMILTGRAVGAEEALAMGLVNRVVGKDDDVVEAAVRIAGQIASFPQRCMLADRTSTHSLHGLPIAEAMRQEFLTGTHPDVLGDIQAARFHRGAGRHGAFASSKL